MFSFPLFFFPFFASRDGPVWLRVVPPSLRAPPCARPLLRRALALRSGGWPLATLAACCAQRAARENRPPRTPTTTPNARARVAWRLRWLGLRPALYPPLACAIPLPSRPLRPKGRRGERFSPIGSSFFVGWRKELAHKVPNVRRLINAKGLLFWLR